MNKRNLVDRIAGEAHLTKVQAARAIDAFLEGVQDSLLKGDRVALMGFGTFILTERKARSVRDPKTGVEIRIPARRVPRFTPGLDLRAAIEAQHEEANPSHSRTSG